MRAWRQRSLLMFNWNTDYKRVSGKIYHIRRLLGHGKGGYSWLADCDGQQVVVKQIHHEPCDYYTFDNKIEAERRDYERLKEFSTFMVIGRLVAGVHWLTDIVGSVLLSAGLYCLYRTCAAAMMN